MTAVELMDYFSWSNYSSCKLAHDFGGAMMANPSKLDGQKAESRLHPATVRRSPRQDLVQSTPSGSTMNGALTTTWSYMAATFTHSIHQ